MLGFARRIGCAALVAGALAIVFPVTGSATVSGGCQVTAVATSGSTSTSTDLTTTDIWHLKANDVVNGSAKYPTQTYVHAYVFLFGVPFQVYSSSGNGTSGSAGPFYVSDYSRYTRVFAAGGASDSCTGAVLIVIDDQNPFTTYVGLGGLILGAIGLIGILFLAFASHGGCSATFLGILLGLLLGVGAALVAAEAGVVDPRNIAGAVIIGVGVIVGAVTPIVRGRMAGP